MQVLLPILLVAIATVIAEKDKSWTWGDDKQKTSRAAEARYAIDFTICQKLM